MEIDIVYWGHCRNDLSKISWPSPWYTGGKLGVPVTFMPLRRYSPSILICKLLWHSIFHSSFKCWNLLNLNLNLEMINEWLKFCKNLLGRILITKGIKKNWLISMLFVVIFSHLLVLNLFLTQWHLPYPKLHEPKTTIKIVIWNIYYQYYSCNHSFIIIAYIKVYFSASWKTIQIQIIIGWHKK